jgi:DNA polymerase III subunit epsilon
MREIVLDTETTGLDARTGDRLIEIGCVEIINRYPTGVEFHRFLNPETKRVHPDAFNIHGISTESLQDKPFFRTEADAFLKFIGDDPLVIHNATFDIGFINMELEKVGRQPLQMSRVVDTLPLARRKHPGAPATLDALCRRYNIDNTQRTKHGAIVDSLLLAQVYIELLGERQASLVLAANGSGGSNETSGTRASQGRQGPAQQRPTPLPSRLTEADHAAHAAFVATLGPNALWKRVAG